jgi:predicted nuclease of predicted toxin-antitoxin system
MRPLDFPLLADENIHPTVVNRLSTQGKNIVSCINKGLGGKTDVEILRYATLQGRVVLTHDSDFGRLTIRSGEPFVGIIYLRPGHIEPVFTMETLISLESMVDTIPPFLIVAKRKNETVRIRLRTLS